MQGETHPKPNDDDKAAHDALLPLSAKKLHIAREVLRQDLVIKAVVYLGFILSPRV